MRALISLAFAALCVVACFPERISEVGKRCEEPAHPCGEGLFCVAGACASEPSPGPSDAGADGGADSGQPEPDAGHPAAPDAGANMLANGGFDSTPALDGWTLSPTSAAANVSAEQSQVLYGSGAARLEAVSAEATSLTATATSPAGGTGTAVHCASAYVKGDGLEVWLTLSDDAGTTTGSRQPAGASWTKIGLSRPVGTGGGGGGGSETIALSLWGQGASSADWAVFDHVRLWRMTGSVCE